MKTQIKPQQVQTAVRFDVLSAWQQIETQRSDLLVAYQPFLPKPFERLISFGESFATRNCFLILSGSVSESIPIQNGITHEVRKLERGWLLFPQALSKEPERFKAKATYTANKGTKLQPISPEIAELLGLNAQFISVLAQTEDSLLEALIEKQRFHDYDLEYQIQDRKIFMPYFFRCAALEAEVHALNVQLKHPNQTRSLIDALIKRMAMLDEERIRLSAEDQQPFDTSSIHWFGEEPAVNVATSTSDDSDDTSDFDPDVTSADDPSTEVEHAIPVNDDPTIDASGSDETYYDETDGTGMISIPPEAQATSSATEDEYILNENDLVEVDAFESTSVGKPRLTIGFDSELDGMDTDNIPTIRPVTAPPDTSLTHALPSQSKVSSFQELLSEGEDEIPQRRTYFGPDPVLDPNLEQDRSEKRDTLNGIPVAASLLDPNNPNASDEIRHRLQPPPPSVPSGIAVRRGDIGGSDIDEVPPTSKRQTPSKAT